MTGLFEIGSFLLKFLWAIPIALAVVAAAAFLYFGRSAFDALKSMFDLLRSPIGYPIVIIVVLWLAMSYGYKWADDLCDAKSVREQLARERLAHRALIEQMKRQAVIEKDDAVRAALDEEANRKNQDAINETPPNPAECLDRDGARRVRDIR